MSKTILTMSLLTFLGRPMKLPSNLWRSETALRFHQKYLNMCSEDEKKSYGVGTTKIFFRSMS